MNSISTAFVRGNVKIKEEELLFPDSVEKVKSLAQTPVPNQHDSGSYSSKQGYTANDANGTNSEVNFEQNESYSVFSTAIRTALLTKTGIRSAVSAITKWKRERDAKRSAGDII